METPKSAVVLATLDSACSHCAVQLQKVEMVVLNTFDFLCKSDSVSISEWGTKETVLLMVTYTKCLTEEV